MIKIVGHDDIVFGYNTENFDNLMENLDFLIEKEDIPRYREVLKIVSVHLRGQRDQIKRILGTFKDCDPTKLSDNEFNLYVENRVLFREHQHMKARIDVLENRRKYYDID